MKSHARRRASSILVVLIFTAVIGMLAASLLSFTLTERRINRRHVLRFQVKNAVEAALEYASSELRARLQNNLNFARDEFSTSPIAVHSSRLSTLFPASAAEFNYVDSSTVQLWASQSTVATRRLIDSTNPGNDFDPLRGQSVSARAVRFLASAAAGDESGNSVAAYGTQSIEIRDAALFNYAIFYNLTMEFHPSPNMRIFGPVHSNEDSYLTEGAGIQFYDTFTTAGSLSIGTIGSGRPSGRNISFTTGLDLNNDGTPDLVTANNPSLAGQAVGSWVDSELESRVASKNFRDTASQIWNGNVQDADHGIMPQHPPGVDTGGNAHDLIEPPDASMAASSDPGEVTRESQKFSNKAGLYLVVESNGNTLGFHNPSHAESFKAQTAANRATWLANNPEKVVVLPSDMVNSSRRMYDFREGRWINTIDINIGEMRTAVNPPGGTPAAQKFQVDGGDWEMDNAGDGDGSWNGVVYVDVESPTTGFTATSDVGTMGSGTGTRTAVRLVNGSDLPNRRAAAPSNSALPEGVTIATNAAVYVVGHYNADGSLAGDMSDMTTPESDEVPAAIVADAINVLSNAWWDSSTGKPAGDSTSSSSTRPAASHTEISAAFLTGIVSTAGAASNQYSGGVENYPRFHENWSNRSLRYRGSIVALFNSEVATGPWSSARYSPPRREWGFNSMFGSERRYPPGTPVVRSYRRLDYRDLTKAEFDAFLADTNLQFVEM